MLDLVPYFFLSLYVFRRCRCQRRNCGKNESRNTQIQLRVFCFILSLFCSTQTRFLLLSFRSPILFHNFPKFDLFRDLFFHSHAQQNVNEITGKAFDCVRYLKEREKFERVAKIFFVDLIKCDWFFIRFFLCALWFEMSSESCSCFRRIN